MSWPLIAFAALVAVAPCLIALWHEVNHAIDCILDAAFNP